MKIKETVKTETRNLHCDSCGIALGNYLYGKGGIEERAYIFGKYSHRLPDIICRNCWSEGYSVENPKYKEKVYSKEFLKRAGKFFEEKK